MLARSHLVFVVITMLFGASATLWGLSQMQWPVSSSFNWSAKFLYIGYFLVEGVIITGIARWKKVGNLTAGALTLGLISIVTGTIWPLFVNLWFVCASFVLGLTILSILKIDKGNIIVVPNI